MLHRMLTQLIKFGLVLEMFCGNMLLNLLQQFTVNVVTVRTGGCEWRLRLAQWSLIRYHKSSRIKLKAVVVPENAGNWPKKKKGTARRPRRSHPSGRAYVDPGLCWVPANPASKLRDCINESMNHARVCFNWVLSTSVKDGAEDLGLSHISVRCEGEEVFKKKKKSYTTSIYFTRTFIAVASCLINCRECFGPAT